MIRKLVALLWAVAFLPLLTSTPAAAAPAPSPQVQTLVFDAILTNARSDGPGPKHVGHRQIASGLLRDATGRRTGTFSLTCTWTRVEPGGASESCRASALTSDGRLDAAGPSQSNGVMHTWRLTGGTGLYRSASGNISLRDLGERETLLSAAVRTPANASLHAGKVSRPAADRAFVARADDLCRRAGIGLANLPPFPFSSFDPLHPDPPVLPDVGAFFTGPGDPRPILSGLDTRLHELGQPPRESGVWRAAMRAREHELTVIDEQDRAALAADVPSFVRSVHQSAADFRQIAIAETVFGTLGCVL